MSINIVHIRENETDKTVFFSIDILGEDNPIEWHADVPLNKDSQTHLESIEEKITLLILRRFYPDSDYLRFFVKERTEIEAFYTWITAGHRNIIGKEDGKNVYEIIEKKAWKSTHPPHLKKLKLVDEADIPTALQMLLKDVITG